MPSTTTKAPHFGLSPRGLCTGLLAASNAPLPPSTPPLLCRSKPGSSPFSSASPAAAACFLERSASAEKPRFWVTSNVFCCDGKILPMTAEARAWTKHHQKAALAFDARKAAKRRFSRSGIISVTIMSREK